MAEDYSIIDRKRRTKVISPWQIIKDRVLISYYSAGENLKSYRERNGDPYYWKLFKSTIIGVYIDIRPDIKDKLDPEKYKPLAQLEKQMMNMNEEWLSSQKLIECYLLIGEALRELGYTKIEVPANEKEDDFIAW